jgi:hypothetical protein
MSEDSGDENIMEDIAQDVREFADSVTERIRMGIRMGIRRGCTDDLRESVKFRLLRSLFNQRTLTFDKEVDAFELTLLHEAVQQLNLQSDFVSLDFDLDVVGQYTRLDDGSVRLDHVNAQGPLADMPCQSASCFTGESVPCESVSPLLTRVDTSAIIDRRKSYFEEIVPPRFDADQTAVHHTTLDCVLVGHVRDAMMM